MSCSQHQFLSLFIKVACSHPDAIYALSDIDSIDPVELIDDRTDDREASEGRSHHMRSWIGQGRERFDRFSSCKCMKRHGEFQHDYYHVNQVNHFSGLGCNVEGARQNRALSS